MHYAEDRGVCADAERQGQHGHRGEAGIFSEQAQRKLYVLQ
jgi:hypothetical protein